MQARNTAGLLVPWVYVRRDIARAYHVPPHTIDLWPHDEVDIELRIREIEGKAGAARAQRQAAQAQAKKRG